MNLNGTFTGSATTVRFKMKMISASAGGAAQTGWFCAFSNPFETNTGLWLDMNETDRAASTIPGGSLQHTALADGWTQYTLSFPKTATALMFQTSWTAVECYFDDFEVLAPGGSKNYVTNGTFDETPDIPDLEIGSYTVQKGGQTLTAIETGALTVSVSAENNFLPAFTATLIVVLNEGDKMRAYSVASANLAPNGIVASPRVLSADIDVPAVTSETTLEIFLWNGLDSMKRLRAVRVFK
jgi:hypothetical protein